MGATATTKEYENSKEKAYDDESPNFVHQAVGFVKEHPIELAIAGVLLGCTLGYFTLKDRT